MIKIFVGSLFGKKWVWVKTTSFCSFFFPKRRRFAFNLKKKNRNEVVLSHQETKRRRFMEMPATTKGLLLFVVPVSGGGVGGLGGGRQGRGPAASRWN